ncbi:MAG: hypothetical protein KKB02_07835 [Alphaproteobacteria bacterium]|nr:hypothetical protein [Alphaproteobacteria bacterium]
MSDDTAPPWTTQTSQTAQIERLRADLARHHAELATLQRMVIKLESDLAAVQVREQKATRARILAERRLDEIRTSLPWRLAAPLRALRRRLRPQPPSR